MLVRREGRWRRGEWRGEVKVVNVFVCGGDGMKRAKKGNTNNSKF